METTVAEILDPITENQPGTQGIQVDIMANRPHGFLFQQNGLVAALKYIPIGLPEPIEAIGEGRLRPLHPDYQVGLRRLDQQMVVVAHQTPGMQRPALRTADQMQAFKKTASSALGPEYPGPAIASIDHVAEGSSVFNSDLPGHESALAIRTIASKAKSRILGLTPPVPTSATWPPNGSEASRHEHTKEAMTISEERMNTDLIITASNSQIHLTLVPESPSPLSYQG